MASLIHEGTGTGQGWENEQVSELGMRSEPIPSKNFGCRWSDCEPG